MTMPKQIDVKVTKPQNKHGQGRTRKCPIMNRYCIDKDHKNVKIKRLKEILIIKQRVN